MRFDLDSAEGSRRAAEWILGIMSHVPATHHLGLEVKQAKVLDTFRTGFTCRSKRSNRLRRQLRRPAATAAAGRPGLRRGDCLRPAVPADRPVGGREAAEIRQSELDRTDLELIQIVLSEPETITWLMPRAGGLAALQDAPLRDNPSGCATTFKTKGKSPSYENLMVRLDDPAVRSLAASLIAESALSTPDPGRFPDSVLARLPGASGSSRS